MDYSHALRASPLSGLSRQFASSFENLVNPSTGLLCCQCERCEGWYADCTPSCFPCSGGRAACSYTQCNGLSRCVDDISWTIARSTAIDSTSDATRPATRGSHIT